jgi:hypothetical protein
MPHIYVQVHRYTLRNCEIRIAGGRRIELIAERIGMPDSLTRRGDVYDAIEPIPKSAIAPIRYASRSRPDAYLCNRLAISV